MPGTESLPHLPTITLFTFIAVMAVLGHTHPSNRAAEQIGQEATQIPGQVVNGAGEVANEVGRATKEAIFGQSTPPSQPNSQ
jgi:hypothetical protein